MSPRRIVGWVFFAAGIVFVIFGIREADTVSEKVVKEVTGEYTHATMWYFIGGILLILLGGSMTIGRRKQ